jgi:hypothetical protein
MVPPINPKASPISRLPVSHLCNRLETRGRGREWEMVVKENILKPWPVVLDSFMSARHKLKSSERKETH